MQAPTLLVLFVSLSANFAAGNSCGGLLEGEHGRFSLPVGSNEDKPGTRNSSCLWIIQLHYENNIRFTLDQLSEDSHLNLYPEGQLTTCSASNYTKLNATHIGSWFEFTGKTLIVILPNPPSSLAFSWQFASTEDKMNKSEGFMKNADYISSPSGLLEWEQLELKERVTWAINPIGPVNLEWNLNVAISCDVADNCACVYFEIFQLTTEGLLSEAVALKDKLTANSIVIQENSLRNFVLHYRTCGESSKGNLEGISGRVVVLIKVNTKVEAKKVSVSWGLDNGTVTEPPVTQPPVPTASGLFAAISTGVVSLDLETLEATALTMEDTRAVAVNNNLSKVYWSQGGSSNYSILRSNLDGTSKEIIVPTPGDNIYALAIDEASGNVYYALYNSHEFTVCNALGKNCTAVISNSSLVNNPLSIALDSENGVMYWGNRLSGANSLVRANLDGSNAGIISTGFTDLQGITLDKPSNVIYWTDYTEKTIGTFDVSGGSKQTLVEIPNVSGLRGIQVNNEKIYFVTAGSGTVLSVGKYSGRNLTTVFSSTSYVYNLALYNAPINQS